MIKNNLLQVYDTINRIAAKHKTKGIDRSAWFLTPDQFSEVKNDDQNIIL